MNPQILIGTKKLACFVVIDDESYLAQDLIDALSLPKYVDCIILDSYSKVKSFLEKNSYSKYFFVIDLNLYEDKKAGIYIIKLIREFEKTQSSFILVYSAYKNLKEPSILQGGDIFLHRNPNQENEIVTKEIYNVLNKSFLNDELLNSDLQMCMSNIWDNSTLIPAKVFDFSDEFVILNCMIDTDNQTIVEKKFSKSIIGDVSIGDSIMISIKDRPNRICYLFGRDESDKVSNYFIDKNFDKKDDIDDCLFV